MACLLWVVLADTVLLGGISMEAVSAIEQGSSANARWAAEAEMSTLRDVIFTAQAATLQLIAALPAIQASVPVAEGRGISLDQYA